MNITPMRPTQLAEVAAFIARLQADSAHFIGYFGEREDDISVYIQELEPNGSDGFLLAHENDQLVGILGIEAEPEIGRAWIHGPMVDHADWHAIADSLYEAARQQIIPAFVNHHELFGDIANDNLRAFAARHGFTPLPDTAAVLRFERHQLSSLPHAEAAAELSPPYHEAFIQLHEATFPKTYYSGQQVIGRLNERGKAFIVTENESLLGYLYAQLDSGNEGYVDFLGVVESARRRGIGKRLIITATRWLLSSPGVQQVHLTVNGQNSAAISLYTGLGYSHLYTLQAYRKY
jgi:GNAT superfamily N-acetyltransferase